MLATGFITWPPPKQTQLPFAHPTYPSRIAAAQTNGAPATVAGSHAILSSAARLTGAVGAQGVGVFRSPSITRGSRTGGPTGCPDRSSDPENRSREHPYTAARAPRSAEALLVCGVEHAGDVHDVGRTSRRTSRHTWQMTWSSRSGSAGGVRALGLPAPLVRGRCPTLLETARKTVLSARADRLVLLREALELLQTGIEERAPGVAELGVVPPLLGQTIMRGGRTRSYGPPDATWCTVVGWRSPSFRLVENSSGFVVDRPHIAHAFSGNLCA